MKKLFKQAVGQIIVLTIFTQMLSQYGYPIIPQIVSSAEETETSYSDENIDTDEEVSPKLTDTLPEDAISVESVQYGEESVLDSENTYEDWTIDSDVTLNEFKEVNNLTINSGTLNLNGYKIIVHGDVILTQKGYLNCNRGEIICNNFIMNNSSYLHMTNINDHIVVNGNFVHNGGYFHSTNATAGTIEIKGDFTAKSSNFNPNAEHKVILNGTEKQIISLNGSSSGFNILEINNTSNEGVFSETPVPANKSYVVNNSKVNFAGFSETGMTLTEDKIIDGDYCLSAGTLDLDGHNLTINGNLIQSGGEVRLNGGTLEVTGDYRIQSKTEEDGIYSYSAGYLTMTNEEDKLIIGGDFVTQSTVDHREKLTAGVMTVGGNFKQIRTSGSDYNFVASGNHKVVFSENKMHDISFEYGDYSHFAILDISNAEINLKNTYVCVELIGEARKHEGENLVIINNATIPETVNGNLTISGDYQIKSDVHIKGNLYFTASTYNKKINLNGHTLTVDNEVNINSRNIYFDDGILNFAGNCKFSNTYLYMQKSKDILYVKGNVTFKNGGTSNNATDGKIYIGGNLDIDTNYFNPSKENEIIFNGTEKQTISIKNNNSLLNKVVFDNTSIEGIEFLTACNMNEFYIKNNCKVNFFGGGQAGETLTADKTINGDYCLSAGTLDLNGHNLTINGNLIQSGGEVCLNGGTLEVTGDYRIQSKTEEDGIYSYSAGYLTMTNEEDKLIIGGDFVTQSTVDHREKLTAGVMTVGGNFKQIRTNGSDYNFVASGNHKVVLSGTKVQNINFEKPSYSHLANLEINNKKSVNINTDIYIDKTVYDNTGIISGTGNLYISNLSQINEYNFSGKVYLNSNDKNLKLEQDLTVGDIKVNYLHINGKKLSADNITVNEGIYVEGGTVECRNNLYLGRNSYFSMTDKEDYVLVGGNLTTDSSHSSSDMLTNGVLEIKGDFIQTYDSTFICEENHVTILSGKKASGGREYIQTVQFYKPGTSKFNILKITKPQSQYKVRDYSGNIVSFNLIYNELEENYSDSEPPLKVENVTSSFVGATSVRISWNPSSDNMSVMGYEIYRNGEKIQVTGKTEFTDNHLMPETEYVYEVYAFDECRNYSEVSDKLTVVTEKDTESPSVPQNLKVHSITGSSITIMWNPSTDNVETVGYKIFRDDKEIAEVTGKTVYKDLKLNENSEYTYKIKAYDLAGNCSDFSDSVSSYTVMPSIKSISPKDHEKIGGKMQKITVVFPDTGNSTGNKVKFEYKGSGSDKYLPITEQIVSQKKYSSGYLSAECDWDLKGLNGSYNVRVTLYDADENSCSKEVEYTVDAAGSETPADFNAKSDNGLIVLHWTPSVSANCDKYIIYRADKEDGVYTELAVVSGKNKVMYSDKTVEVGKIYFYKIEAVSSYGIAGSLSDAVSAKVTEDKEMPTVSDILPLKSRVNKTVEITVNATDNISVEKIKLEYKSADSDKWTLIGEEQASDGKAVFKWDTSKLEDGEYTVRAFAFDSNNNCSEDFIKKYTTDNTGIRKIDIIADECTASSSFVSIRWKDVTESDFGWFAVEKKNDSGEFIEVGKTSQITGMHIENLQPNTDYVFRVVGYDDLGNRGEESGEITLTTTSDNINPAIRSFYPASSAFNYEINISINAVDNIGIKNLKLRYSYDSEDEKKWTELASVDASEISTDKTLSYKFDISELPEGEIYIEAVVSDTSGNLSESCINKYKIDRTSPNSISDLKADGSNGSVHLTWTVSDDDIKSFEIYRCEDEKGVYSKIATCSTKDYYDTSAKFSCTYTYKIVAVDIAGNKSDDSNETIAQVADDITAPSVLGFRYSSGTVLPANPSFSVIAKDNYKLSKAEIEYRKSDSENGIWYELCTLDMNSSYQSVDFKWNTTDMTEGKYILKAIVYDIAGNISKPFTAEYTLDLTEPAKPDIEVIQGNWELTVQWSKNNDDDFDFYRLYRKSASDSEFICLGDTRENSYTDTDVSPEKMYSYKIKAYDKCGNYSENVSNSVRPNNIDKVPPQANISEQIFGITDSEVVFDGSESTDNVRISKFEWDFGDNSKGDGIRTVHIYKDAGEYEAKLTVYDDAGYSDSSTFTVTVYDRTKYGNMQIEVTDDSGRPIKYAYVYLYSSENDSEISLRADSNGIASISASTGKHQIAVYKDGYLPVKKEIELNSIGDNDKIRVAMQSGELVTGNLSVHRMSLEEMIEAGIDFNNPENYHTYSFTIELTFVQEPIPTVIHYIYSGGSGGYGGLGGGFGGGGFIGGGSSGSVKLSDGSTVKIQPIVYDSPEIEEEIPILAYVKTSQEISFMKDIYAVDLGVINNASKDFVIKNCSATLNLPDGLSLAATTKKQSLIQDMGDILGQEKKTVSWAVKGDKKGEYNLSADFSGTLMPFNAPVRANFKTDEPFKVGAGDGIVIYVKPESAAYIDEDYYIQFEVVNEGKDTFYNLKTSFGDLINPGFKRDVTVILPDGQVTKDADNDEKPSFVIENANQCRSIPVIYGDETIQVNVFEPGDRIYGTYVTGFSAEGNPEEVYYNLIDYIVEEQNKNTNVQVVFSPIPSHITKYNVKQEIVTDTWGDPVDMTTGGFIDSITAMSITGDSVLDFNLNYNSMNSNESGELGYGWSHNFETYLDISPSGVNVHWSPTNYASFIDEDFKLRNVNGIIQDNQITITDLNDVGAKNYLPLSAGLDGYVLHRDEQGIYTLTAPGGAENIFDENGQLIQTISTNGKKINIEHSGNTAVISEEITGVKLIVTYNDFGRIICVEDGNGRKSTITYENDCISSVTNASGNTVSYEYDENNRLISAIVEGDERPYVVNKYDENGRVTEQDDGDENTPLTYFYYEHNKVDGTLTVTATDRNNVFDAQNKKNSHQVKYVSDWYGHVISFTDQNGATTVYTYDLKGNLIIVTDASGNKTFYSYDENGWVTLVKDTYGNTTRMNYDDNGNIISIIGPNGEKSSYIYNENNLLVKSVENSGVVTKYEYNENSQLLTETVEGLGSKSYSYVNGRITSVTDFMGNVSEMTYDAYGNIASVTDRDGNKTSYVYDELNRLISQTTADGTTSYIYDSRGNKISATDTRNNTVNYSYNGNNFMTQVETVKGITKYDYDNEGRLIAQTAPDGTVFRNEYDPVGNIIKSVNENGEICEYTYDATGNVKTKTLVNGTDKYTEKYEYYSGGKLQKIIFADGTSENYEYDSSWRLTKVTNKPENSSVTEYDNNGNVISITDAEDNKIQYTYDKYGRILTSTDANGNVTTFDKYDANGNCLQETLPSGQIICMTYSNEGLLLTVTMKCDDGDISISYEYDASGRVTKYT
ncbi:MAG: PKD domain-containing protein, partial [Muribaculaceae bacterium]|nr:PKD domain-containing protein [Alistipes senegalensis]MCM1473051.1 PKD domain-containing protein [Muribaculaceae bacterium]